MKKNEAKLSLKDSALYIVSADLMKILNDHIAYGSTINDNDDSRGNIYIVDFQKRYNDCYVQIFESPFYLSDSLWGYFILNDKLIVFNKDVHGECSRGLVNLDKLETDFPEQFPNENSNIVKRTYDGYAAEYKIILTDSIPRLIFVRRI
ncbi:MAG: hypothetical protein JW801_10405 [Bacteroidales bacterium]|nr:hypothetical protein [Bacteroidales bacterium]